jgi:cytochrome c-type biogenesis protein CcmH/NrfF
VRSRSTVAVLAIIVSAFLQGSALGVQPKTSLEKVGSQVYCQCGCVTTLNHCPHLPSQCQSRAEITGVILQGIHKGETEPAILQDLARRYGVQVLAAPPAKGFDLAAWVLPGFGLVIGLFAVLLVIKYLRDAPRSKPVGEDVPVDDKIMAAVEEEMKKAVMSDE